MWIRVIRKFGFTQFWAPGTARLIKDIM